MLSKEANVSLQGLEFWCSISEIELNLASGVYDPECILPISMRSAEKALPKLVSALMLVLAQWQFKRNNLDDFDDWSPFKGALACLTLLSKCCSNTIDFYVLPEVKSRITVKCIKICNQSFIKNVDVAIRPTNGSDALQRCGLLM